MILDFCKKRDGVISVFLTLILIPVMMFGGVIVDGTRIFGSKNIISGAGEMAMNGALAEFDRSLNDAYGLIAMSETPQELQSRLQDYFESSLNANGLTERDFNKALIELQLLEGSFVSAAVENTQIYQTEVMKQEIMEYMKYRAPVMMVSNGILGKLSGFSGIDKEKKAIDNQIKFESEMEDLQQKFDEILEQVDIQKEVYGKIKSNEEISRLMQQTKDDYGVMLMLAAAYDRLSGIAEAEEGEVLALIESYNDWGEELGIVVQERDGRATGLDGFDSMLHMLKIELGVDDPEKALEGLDPKSEEYQEARAEVNMFYNNQAWLAECVHDVENALQMTSDTVKKELKELYELAMNGYDSAVDIQDRMEKMRKKLEECQNLYDDWTGSIGEMPDSDTKTEMSNQAAQFAGLFDKDNSDEFNKRVENNKQYYDKVCQSLEEMRYSGNLVVTSVPREVVQGVVSGKTAGIGSNAELHTLVSQLHNGSWEGPTRLDTGGLDKQDLEPTDFVKYLREKLCNKELSKSEKKSNKAESEKQAKKWTEELNEKIEAYKNLFLSDDIEDVSVLEKGNHDLPSVWLSQLGNSGGGTNATLEGDLNHKSGRKKASSSATSAMNTNNSSLTLLGGLSETIYGAVEAAYITEYVMGMLSHYVAEKDASGGTIATPLSLSNASLKEHILYRSEIEYVIWGDDSTRGNITKTKAMIFAVQFVCNALFAFTNSKLTGDAWEIAALFPVGPLAKSAIKTALLAVVTIIETTQDLKQLMDGEAVELRKGPGSWETWLMGAGAGSQGSVSMRYEDYLWVMVCINVIANPVNLLARTADCIELNQTSAKTQNENTLKNRYTMVSIGAQVKTSTYFLQRLGAETDYHEDGFIINYQGIRGY